MLFWSKCSEQTTSQECTAGRTDPIPTNECPKQLSRERSGCSPNVKLETSRLHSGAGCDRPEATKIPTIPPILEVVWQQPPETFTDQYSLDKTINDSTKQHTRATSKTTVASQTWPPMGTQPQNCVVATEQPPGNQTGNEPVPFLNCSKNCPTDTQNSEQQVTTTLTENTTIPPLTMTTPI